MPARSVRRGSFSYQLPYVAPLYRSIYGIVPTGTLHCPIVPYCIDCQTVLREIRRHQSTHKAWRHLNFARSNRPSPSSIIFISTFHYGGTLSIDLELKSSHIHHVIRSGSYVCVLGDVHHDVLDFVISFTIGISDTTATAAKLFSFILPKCTSSSNIST